MKKKKVYKLIKVLNDFMLANGHTIDFERPLIIKGHRTDYSITRAGDVISYKYYNTDKPRILQHMMGTNGYHMVNLLIDSKEKTYHVHRLVAETFVPNPDLKSEVNHIDGNKDNNTDQNLEWVTSKENIDHAYKMGLAKGRPGTRHHNASITEEDAAKICEMLQSGKYCIRSVADIMGTTYTVVKKIKNGVRWTHVSKNYDFSNYKKFCNK